jgi:hypothetical protein
MEMNHIFGTIFLCVATLIFIWWILLNRLTGFLEIATAITHYAFKTISLFIKRYIHHPIQHVFKRIHIPIGIKIVLYFLIGIGILLFDHFYGTTIYEADETTFYRFIIQGVTYWVTKEGLIFGGFFIGVGLLLLLMKVLEFINKILSTPIHISITIRK